jgi:hypothetical protein
MAPFAMSRRWRLNESWVFQAELILEPGNAGTSSREAAGSAQRIGFPSTGPE